MRRNKGGEGSGRVLVPGKKYSKTGGGGGGKTVLVPGVETRCNKGKDGSQLVV